MADYYKPDDGDSGSSANSNPSASPLAKISLNVSAFVLAIIFLIGLAEIIGRYFLHSPLVWAFDVSGYLFCLCIFLALPYVVDSGGSITVSLFTDLLSSTAARRVRAALETVAGILCIIVSLFFLDVAYAQFDGSLMTNVTIPIPQYYLTMIAVYGFVLAAIFHLRRAVIALRSRPS